MTFAQLALANLRGNWLRYAAFLLSSTFSVALFYVYAQFLFHPDVASGYIYGGSTTRIVLTVCLVLIAVFAFFFVLYSSGAFLRARNKEFGLLTLMGTTRGQLRRLIWLENSFLSLAAIGAGVLVGMLLSRLFLMALSRVLLIEAPIRFVLVPEALLLAGAGFFVLFQLVTLVGAGSVGRRTVLDMLEEAAKPRVQPRPSVFLAVLGFVLVAGGYAVASLVDGAFIALAFVPVVVAVVLGTHLLFTQGGVFVMRRLARGRAFMRGTRMLVVSQLVFRLKDNARLLASIASLSAVVLAAAGTFYVMSSQVNTSFEGAYPHALTLVEPSEATPRLSTGDVDAILAEQGAVATLYAEVSVAEVRYAEPGEEGTRLLVLVPESSYVEWAGRLGGSAGVGEQAYLRPVEPGSRNGADVTDAEPDAEPDATPVADLVLTADAGRGAVSARRVTPPTTLPIWLSSTWFAVPDDAFDGLVGANALMTVAVYDWEGSSRATALGAAVSEAVPDAGRVLVADKHAQYVTLRQTLGLSLFTGLFVSVLFFIGAGSLIYFKLFTELPDDRHLFARLKRIGITRREAGGVVSRQVALVFLLPFAVGSVHALFALDALGRLLGAVGSAQTAVLGYALTVVGLFSAVQVAFFLLTRWTYLRALLPRT